MEATLRSILSTISRCKCFAVAAAVGLASLLVNQHAGAYVLESSRWPSNTTVQMRMGLGNPGHALQDGSPTWDAAASPALTSWNQQMLRAQFSSVVASSTASSGDGINSVVFASSVFGQSFGSGTLAVTYYRSQGANMTEADVLVNSHLQFDAYHGPLQFGTGYYAIADIRRVLLHELGHALGLDHPDGAGQHVDAIMNSLVGNRETLSSDDIAGVQSLYGRPAPMQPASTSLLWQNNQTGERQIWTMNGTVHTATSSLGVVSTQWNMATSGDFNGDGKLDIAWQNTVTGQNAIWLMNGNTYMSSVAIPRTTVDWELVAAADFNGDGKIDLVWQNRNTGRIAAWVMNRTTYQSSVNLGTAPAHWKIKGAADFNIDGKADLLWQNNLTGQRAVWYMNRTVYSSAGLLPAAPVDWNIAGTGDFNADGKRDIVWQSQSTGARAIWLMNGTHLTNTASLGTVALSWNIRNY